MIPLPAIKPLLTGSRPRLATSMPIGSPAAPHRRDCDSSARRLILAATIHARVAPARSSNAATGRRTRYLSQLKRFDTLATFSFFRPSQFLTIREPSAPHVARYAPRLSLMIQPAWRRRSATLR
jgi:hypothetical protein